MEGARDPGRAGGQPRRAIRAFVAGKLAFLRELPTSHLSTPWRWASAPAAVLFAFLVQYTVLPQPRIAPFVFFFWAVALASWLGGRAPGLIAAVLSALVANYMFIEPYYTFNLHGPGLRATVLFFLGAMPIALLCSALRDALFRAEHAAAVMRRQADLLRLSHDAILVWRPGGTIESWNQGAEELYGYCSEEARGRVSNELLHTVFPEPFAAVEAKLRAAGSWEGTSIHTTKDGRTRTVATRLQLVRDDDGTERVLETNRDVTDRAQAEDRIRHLNWDLAQRAAELDAERRRWRAVVEGIADEVWVSDARGRVIFLNIPGASATVMARFEGKAIAEVMAALDIVPTEGPERAPEDPPLLRSLRGETVRGDEVRRDPESGEDRHRQFTSAPVRDASGAIVGAVSIVRDVTETKRMELALREAHRRKDEFLAVLSHELRNPLAPIKNSLHVLHRVPPGSDQARRAQAVVENQIAHMARLVDDLLDVSRISRGKIQLHRDRVDLAAVVRLTVGDHQSVFAERDIALHTVDPGRPVWVNGDADRITQILGNLLHNAAKFTPARGRVDVVVAEEGSHALVRIRDTGAGIPPDVLAHIFEPFAQGKQALDRAHGGLGLGLSLAKGLAELHGGNIEVRSDEPGAGAEFALRLPLDVAPAGEKRPPAEIVKAPARRVLIIEDNVDAADSLKEALSLDEHEVEVAYDGPSGIEKARRSAPEVVLCDIGLPDMDGYEVARTLRADDALRRTTLVALTGYALAEDRKKALDAGFDRHLSKPPDLDALTRILAALPARGAA